MTAEKERLLWCKFAAAMYCHDDLFEKGDTTKSFLKRNEWSMGNGQCWHCYAHGPNFGWFHEGKFTGHRKGCVVKKLLDLVNA